MKAVKLVGRLLLGYDMYSYKDEKWELQAYDGNARHEDIAKAISLMYDNYRKNGYAVYIGDIELKPESKDKIEFIVSRLKKSARPRELR